MLVERVERDVVGHRVRIEHVRLHHDHDAGCALPAARRRTAAPARPGWPRCAPPARRCDAPGRPSWCRWCRRCTRPACCCCCRRRAPSRTPPASNQIWFSTNFSKPATIDWLITCLSRRPAPARHREEHLAQRREPLERVVGAVVRAVAVGPLVVAGREDQRDRRTCRKAGEDLAKYASSQRLLPFLMSPRCTTSEMPGVGVDRRRSGWGSPRSARRRRACRR